MESAVVETNNSSSGNLNGSSGFVDDDSDDSSIESGSVSGGEDGDSYLGRRRLEQNTVQRGTMDDSNPAITCKNIFSGISIEPMMFAHMFGMSCTSVILQNLYIDRICRVEMGYADSVCGNLTGDLEKEIDEVASKYVTYRSLIEAGFPIIVAMFLGPWTDVHGTKWPMLLPLFGYFLSAMSYLIFSFIPEAPPQLLLISSIPISIPGGLVSIIMSAFSFMAKVTTLENRSFRVAMLEASWFLGGPIGVLVGGVIYKYSGFTAVFSTSASLFLAAFIYGCIVIREEIPEIEGREHRSCMADMFNVDAVKEMFATVFSRRDGLRRRWFLLMLLTISLRIFALFGYLQNMYLYTRSRFGWGTKEYTEYSVSDSFIAISGGYIMIMTCMKIFKLPDSVIGIMSTVGTVVAQLVFAFAAGSWMIYLGSCLQMFSGLISIVLRAMISKIVAKEEIAKVFTFLACGEASMPILAVPLYSYIFRHTIWTFPGAMFMVSASVYLIILISFIYLYVSMKNSNEHVQMDDPTETSA